MDEPPLDRQTVDDIIKLIMRIDAGVQDLLAIYREDDDDDEEETEP